MLEETATLFFKKIIIFSDDILLGPTLFRPDLASVYYTKQTINLGKGSCVDFVLKTMTQLNVLQCRPIEKYWSLVKCKLRRTEQATKKKDRFYLYGEKSNHNKIKQNPRERHLG
jgi:hypothetical protein